MTWHQWQAAYPTDSSTGTSRRRASANASVRPRPPVDRVVLVLEQVRAGRVGEAVGHGLHRAPPTGSRTRLTWPRACRPARHRPGDDPRRRADRAVLPLLRAGRAGRQHHRLAGRAGLGPGRLGAAGRAAGQAAPPARLPADRRHARGHRVRAALAAAQPGSGPGAAGRAGRPRAGAAAAAAAGDPAVPGRDRAPDRVEEAPVGDQARPAGPAPTTTDPPAPAACVGSGGSDRENEPGTLRRCLFIDRTRKTRATSSTRMTTSAIGLASRFSAAAASSSGVTRSSRCHALIVSRTPANRSSSGSSVSTSERASS